jgi:hypothetical protein
MISINKLLKLGFKEHQPRVIEDEFSFDWHRIEKNNSTLDVTTEYDNNNNPSHQYVEFNSEVLQGEVIGLFAIEFLIKLM